MRTLGFSTLIALIIAVVLLVLSQTYPAVPTDIELQKNVRYTKAGDDLLCMDIVRPKKFKIALPVIVCIHGGSWVFGNKKTMLTYAYEFARQGYEVVSIDYRLAPFHRFPAPVMDVKSAVTFLREHSTQMKIDPARIATFGISAGAYLALFAGVVDNRLTKLETASETSPSLVKAVVSVSGPSDLSLPMTYLGEKITENFLGCTRHDNLRLLKQASPVTYVSPYSAHFLLIHGDSDNLVLLNQPVAMKTVCEKLDVPIQLLVLRDAGHANFASVEQQKETISQIIDFLRKNL